MVVCANMQGKSILWLSSLILDMHLHKTTQIEILQALAERGHKVHLVASYSSMKNLHELENVKTTQIPLRYIPIFSTTAYVLFLLLYMPLFLLRWRPDFVIVEPLTAVIGVQSRFLLPRSKTVLDIRSGPVGSRKHTSTIIFFSIAIIIARKFHQGITTITSLSKKELCEKYKIDSKLVGVWTSGVSKERFSPKKYSASKIRKDLGLDDKFVVFYHGYLGRERGIIETIKAVELLKNDYPNIVLFLLGNDEINWKDMIRELGLQNVVVIHDPVSYIEVPKYIAICNVGIVPLPDLPCWRHQCPLKLLEYLSMEKVVITSDIPANREILGNSKCGIYISTVKPKEIANAIVYAYNNRDLLMEWGACGRIIIEERYSWTKVANDLENHLFRL